MAKQKKGKSFWFTIILITAVIGMAMFFFISNKNKPKGTEVTFEKVKKRTIRETVSASGRIFPEKEVKISSDVSGEIVQLLVMEGDSVKAGQLLAKIDPEAFVSNVERGRAAVSGSQASLAQARSQIENAKANKEQIEAQLVNAKSIYDRNKKLLDDGVISMVEMEQSKSTYEGLQANLKAATASIRAAEESAKGAEFNVQSSQASLKELNTGLNRTVIKSPVNGIISSLNVEKGERVVGTMQMAGTEMMRIANLNAMEVQVDVSENDIIRVVLGDSVDIEVDAYLDKTFKGVVTEIANSASNVNSGAVSLNSDQVTNFVVKVRMKSESYSDLITDQNQHPFRPGMSASVDIYSNMEEAVPAIPIQAVTTRIDTSKEKETFDEVVFVHSADTVKLVKVKTGIQDDEYIQILEGLEVNEEIVSGPYSAISKKLEEGDEVREEEKDEKDKKKKKRKKD